MRGVSCGGTSRSLCRSTADLIESVAHAVLAKLRDRKRARSVALIRDPTLCMVVVHAVCANPSPTQPFPCSRGICREIRCKRMGRQSLSLRKSAECLDFMPRFPRKRSREFARCLRILLGAKSVASSEITETGYFSSARRNWLLDQDPLARSARVRPPDQLCRYSCGRGLSVHSRAPADDQQKTASLIPFLRAGFLKLELRAVLTRAQ